MVKIRMKRAGICLMALFGTLILIAALGDLAYPDVLSCYSSQTVEDRAVFCVVEEEKREAP